MKDFIYYNPVKLFVGNTMLESIVKEIKKYGDKILVITGGNSFKKSGHFGTIMELFEENNIEHIEMSRIRKPLLSKVREGIEICKNKKIDLVLGIGGGTCMDVAKAIAFGTLQEKDVWEYFRETCELQPDKHLPIGLIVTFPSSGSEMDGDLQITDDETGEQLGLAGVFPDFSFLNSDYILSLSNQQLIEAQMTTFIQVSLAFLGKERSEIAEEISILIMKQLLKNLKRAIDNPDDIVSRQKLMLLDSLNFCGLTTMGKETDWSLYTLEGIVQNCFKIGYKQAIITMFPYWICACADKSEVFKEYFSLIFNVDTVEAGIEEIKRMYKSFGIPVNYGEFVDIYDERQVKTAIDVVGKIESMYGTFSEEKIESVIRAAYGI